MWKRIKNDTRCVKDVNMKVIGGVITSCHKHTQKFVHSLIGIAGGLLDKHFWLWNATFLVLRCHGCGLKMWLLMAESQKQGIFFLMFLLYGANNTFKWNLKKQRCRLLLRKFSRNYRYIIIITHWFFYSNDQM